MSTCRRTAITPMGWAQSRRKGNGPASEGLADSLLGMSGGDLVVGTVLAVDKEAVQVLGEDGRSRSARRAAACLLAPEAGDAVLLLDRGRSGYVLSVLEKSNSASTLEFPGDVRIEGAGKATLAGRETELFGETVQIAGETARISGRGVEISGVSGEFRFVEASVSSKSLRLGVDKAVCLARVVESTVDRAVQRMKHCFRQVAEVDTLKAGAVRRFIAGRFFQRSKNASILADQKIKVDGDKIELG